MAVQDTEDGQLGFRYVEKDDAFPVGKASDAVSEFATINAGQSGSGECFDLGINIEKEAVGRQRVFAGNIAVILEEVCSRSG